MHRFYYWLFSLSLIGIYAKLLGKVDAAYSPIVGATESSIGIQLFVIALIGFAVCFFHLLRIYDTLHEFECPKETSGIVTSWFGHSWTTSRYHKRLINAAGIGLLIAALKASGIIHELVGLVPRAWLWKEYPGICSALYPIKTKCAWLWVILEPDNIFLLFAGSLFATVCLVWWDAVAKRHLAPESATVTAKLDYRQKELSLWLWTDILASAYWLVALLVVMGGLEGLQLMFFLVTLVYAGLFIWRRGRDSVAWLWLTARLVRRKNGTSVSLPDSKQDEQS